MREHVLPLLDAAERRFDAWRGKVIGRIKAPGAPFIQTYRGFGTAERVTVRGRLLQDPRLRKPMPDDTLLDNVVSMLRRMESDEIPGARLRVVFAGNEVEVTTDEEGYFTAELHSTHPLDEDTRWHEATVTLVESPIHPPGTEAESPAEILIPPATATFGVISDVDDTILQTGATDFIGMMRTTLAGNAHTRLPFEGVAGFYRALAHGTSDTNDNPVFYVSSSPWNLYDLLVDFMEIQGIPHGPLALRDLGLDATKFIKSGHAEHKTAAIERILDAYPALPFVLIGDSGQHDPEIYAEVARRHPERVLCIYIRDVASKLRDEEVGRIAAELALEDIDMQLVPDSLAAARHAAEQGWIREVELPEVAAEKAKDEAAGHES